MGSLNFDHASIHGRQLTLIVNLHALGNVLDPLPSSPSQLGFPSSLEDGILGALGSVSPLRRILIPMVLDNKISHRNHLRAALDAAWRRSVGDHSQLTEQILELSESLAGMPLFANGVRAVLPVLQSVRVAPGRPGCATSV